MNKLIILALASALFTLNAFAHPGRTASDGCHYCRTNCEKWGVPHGTRHCHGGLKPEIQLEIMKSAAVNKPSSKAEHEMTHSHGVDGEHSHSEEMYN